MIFFLDDHTGMLVECVMHLFRIVLRKYSATPLCLSQMLQDVCQVLVAETFVRLRQVSCAPSFLVVARKEEVRQRLALDFDGLVTILSYRDGL